MMKASPVCKTTCACVCVCPKKLRTRPYPFDGSFLSWFPLKKKSPPLSSSGKKSPPPPPTPSPPRRPRACPDVCGFLSCGVRSITRVDTVFPSGVQSDGAVDGGLTRGSKRRDRQRTLPALLFVFVGSKQRFGARVSNTPNSLCLKNFTEYMCCLNVQHCCLACHSAFQVMATSEFCSWTTTQRTPIDAQQLVLKFNIRRVILLGAAFCLLNSFGWLGVCVCVCCVQYVVAHCCWILDESGCKMNLG